MRQPSDQNTQKAQETSRFTQVRVYTFCIQPYKKHTPARKKQHTKEPQSGVLKISVLLTEQVQMDVSQRFAPTLYPKKQRQG